MYFLGLGLLILSTWYLLKLYGDFNNDPVAKKEIRDALKVVKEDAQASNPFKKGRIKAALDIYKNSRKKT